MSLDVRGPNIRTMAANEEGGPSRNRAADKRKPSEKEKPYKYKILLMTQSNVGSTWLREDGCRKQPQMKGYMPQSEASYTPLQLCTSAEGLDVVEHGWNIEVLVQHRTLVEVGLRLLGRQQAHGWVNGVNGVSVHGTRGHRVGCACQGPEWDGVPVEQVLQTS